MGGKIQFPLFLHLSCNFPLRDNDSNKYFMWCDVKFHIAFKSRCEYVCLLDTITCWHTTIEITFVKTFSNRTEIRNLNDLCIPCQLNLLLTEIFLSIRIGVAFRRCSGPIEGKAMT